MAFGEKLCSVVILGPKWSNKKFVYLLEPSNDTGANRSVLGRCFSKATEFGEITQNNGH